MAGAFSNNQEEIKYNVINSFLAGALVFAGAFIGAEYNLSLQGFIGAFMAAAIVALNSFKQYWSTQEGEYKRKKHLFAFV